MCVGAMGSSAKRYSYFHLISPIKRAIAICFVLTLRIYHILIRKPFNFTNLQQRFCYHFYILDSINLVCSYVIPTYTFSSQNKIDGYVVLSFEDIYVLICYV